MRASRARAIGSVIAAVVPHERPGLTSLTDAVRAPALRVTLSIVMTYPPELRLPIAATISISRSKSTFGTGTGGPLPSTIRDQSDLRAAGSRITKSRRHAEATAETVWQNRELGGSRSGRGCLVPARTTRVSRHRCRDSSSRCRRSPKVHGCRRRVAAEHSPRRSRSRSSRAPPCGAMEACVANAANSALGTRVPARSDGRSIKIDTRGAAPSTRVASTPRRHTKISSSRPGI